MEGFIVHSIPGSPYGRTVLAALEEKGAAYRFAAMPKAETVFGELSRLLGDQDYFAGAAVSLADLMVGPQLDMLSAAPEWATLTANRPNLQAWLARVQARPSFVATTWERVTQMAKAPDPSSFDPRHRSCISSLKHPRSAAGGSEMSDVCALDFDLSPLDGHSILDSADADEAERVFARVYRLGKVKPKGGSREFVARMQHRRIGGFSINRLKIDTPADVDTGVLRDFYLIHTPVQGRAQVTSRGRSVALRAGESAIYSTRAASLLELEPGCDRLMIRLDREVVERVAGAVLGHPPSRPIEFAPHLQGGSTAYLRWWGLVQHVLAELARDPHAWDAPLVRSSLEQMLAATLLQYQPNDALPGSGFTPAAAAPPRRVRRVMDWIAAHAHEPVTLDDVAAVAGCGLSALYAGFRDTLGTTPMAYLRDIRLERVRAELRAADPATCRVTEVATRWGFFHFGRFAGAYKRRFGELPRDTLRR